MNVTKYFSVENTYELQFWKIIESFLWFLGEFFLFLFCIYDWFVYVYVCAPHAYLGAHRGQKRASNFLEKELQKIVSCCYMDPVNQTQVLWKSNHLFCPKVEL